MSDYRSDIVALFDSYYAQEVSYDSVLATLAKMDRDPTLLVLKQLLHDPDSEIRGRAAEMLLQLQHDATDAILPLLADEEWIIRWHICGLLHDFGDARAVPGLIQVLRNDPEGDVRHFAAWALQAVGDLSAIPALRHAMEFDTGGDHEGRLVADMAREAIKSIQERHSKPLDPPDRKFD